MTESSPKGSLPYGWQVRVSKSRPDRVYYFNIATGCSTWECPELDPPREDEQSSCTNVKIQDVVQIPSKPSLLKESIEDIYVKSGTSVLHKSSMSKKLHSPPTAVVVPVMNNVKEKSKIISKDSSHLVDTAIKAGNDSVCKVKRKSDTFEDSACDQPKKIRKKIKKKTKNSPLNRSDVEPTQATKEVPYRVTKESCKLSSSKSSLDVLHAAVRELPQEVANDDATNSDDIEMLDVSMEIMKDLTSREDIVVDTFASYYVVVDTNVLISELHLINELKDTPLDGCGPPHIFIPWVVIEELDGLKKNRNAKTTMRAACEAVRYLNSVLSKHPRFHGQSPSEAEDWAKTYSKCNDDRILECCLALGDKMSPEKVILLTNDKNLVNKALICSIKVHDWASMMKCVKPDVNFSVSKQKEKWKNPEKEASKPASVSEISKSNTVQKKLLANQQAKYKREIHTVMSNARQLLKNVISNFLEEEMHKAYGRTWVLFPIETKLLDGMLAGIIRYWKMVFSDIFTEKDKGKFEYLSKLASRPEGFLADKDESMVILNTIEYVFIKIKERCPQLRVPVETIQEFRTACADTFYSSCQIENTIEVIEKETTLAVFERNWSAINQLCGMVLDFCEIPHDLQYDKPKELPPEIEFRRLFCNLYPGVQQLKNFMSKMLDAVRKSHPAVDVSKKLCKALLHFIPSLEIPHDPVSYPHFTPTALERFCFSKENREMIEIGYKQIEKFYSKLDAVIRVLMSAKFKKINITPETMICD